MKLPPRILIVEDESIVAFNLQQRLAHMGYDVPGVAASGPESLDMIQRLAPDLVLMDIHIDGDMDGIDVASRLMDTPSVPVIYLTAYSEDTTLERARKTKPYGYLIKPFSERELHATIQMALERNDAEMALLRHQRLLQQAMQAGSMGALEMDLDTREITPLGQTNPILGWGDTLKATLEDLLDRVVEEDRAAFSGQLNRSLEQRTALSAEFRVKDAGQTERWIRLDASPWPNHQMSGVVQDITGRKLDEIRLKDLNESLEGLVRERTSELYQSIRELEAFSSSVAHDLRAPLRAIVGFGQEVLNGHANALGEDGREMMERITAAGKRMGALIDALLNMSRMTQLPLHKAPVDISAMATEIADYLLHNDPDRVGEVTIAPGMQAVADPTLLRSVLDNLMRNAWKFTAQCEVARIEVSAEQQGPHTVFCVRDNGCGFDMAFASKLFGPFQRLHRQQDYAGTGLGLTIVQRVIMRHGGQVWAESAPGQGAAFHFTLSC
ncbi:MAG: sensor histidine kinase [Hydrogenophaga sp.]